MKENRKPGRTVAMALAAAAALALGLVGRTHVFGLRAPGPAPDARPGEVEFSGCEDVLAGPVCVVKADAQLVIWLPLSPQTQVLAPAGARRKRVQDGLQLTVAVDAHLSPIVLEVRQSEPPWRWQLRLEPSRRDARLTEAIKRNRQGKPQEAASVLDQVWGQLRASDRAVALELRAEMALRAGDESQGFALRAEAAGQAIESGLFARAARQYLALSHAHLYGSRSLQQAQQALAQALALPIDAATMVDADMQRGHIAAESGDLATALEALASSAARGERLALSLKAWLARQKQAGVLGNLGRFDEALEQFRGLARELGDKTACHRRDFFNNFAWQQLLASEAQSPVVADPAHEDAAFHLQKALAYHRDGCPSAAEKLPNLEVNLALALFQAGRSDEAREVLARSRRGPSQSYVELWRLDLEGRLALARGDPAAGLAAYRGMVDLAVRTLSTGAQWRATVGRARSLAAQGRRDRAIAAYREAEALLDEQLLEVPLGQGKGYYLAARDVATGEMLMALLARGQNAQAVEVARRSGIRALTRVHQRDHLRSLSEEQRGQWQKAAADFLAVRDDLERQAGNSWSLAGSELALERSGLERRAARARHALAAALATLARTSPRGTRLAPAAVGEVILGYHPLARAPSGITEWLGYALAAGTVKVARVSDVDPSRARSADQRAELARRLLLPFAPLIDPARRVRVLGYGPLAQLDFHALPYRGAPLGAGRQVVYSLNLPASETRPGDAAAKELSRGPAVVVADPGGNLPEARREGDEVVALLRKGHAHLVSVLGPRAGPSGAVIRPMLAGASLFHYAGHASSGGTDGIASQLSLQRGSSLSLEDVLALEQAPRHVVISGCATGRGSRQAGADLGLAQAFVLAGSEAVVATAREVGDGVARALSTRLHGSGADNLGEALRLAQLALARDLPEADWAAFRVVVR